MNYINKWMQVVEQWQDSNNDMAQFVDEMIRSNKENYTILFSSRRAKAAFAAYGLRKLVSLFKIRFKIGYNIPNIRYASS